MRIGIEAQRLYRKNKHGMDIVALELIKGLQKVDKENEYFIFIKEDEDKQILEATDNFHLVELSSSVYPIWEQYTLPKAVKEYKIDLLHCTANTAPLKVDVPLVVTVHDIIFLEHINLKKGTWYNRIGNLYRRWIVPKLIDKCAMITTVSDYEKENIKNYFKLDDSNIQTIHNGVGTHFRPISDNNELSNIRSKYSLPERFILAFGNQDPRKNFANNLDAYVKVRRAGHDIKLVVTDVKDSYLDGLLQSMDATDLATDIVKLGYVPNRDLPYIYNLAEIFVFPSTRESFGIPVLESMGCGTPVVSSETSSIPEIAGDAAILVSPYKSDEIFEGVRKLLENKDLYADMREASIARAPLFSWEASARKSVEMYQSVYNKSKAS